MEKQFAVLPFRKGPLIDVLLVASETGSPWRIPACPRRKGITQHANAALEARRQVGVSGRVYKSPVRARGAGRGITVFPLLVQSEADVIAQEDGATAQWVTLEDAAQLVGHDLSAVLDAFARRVGA